MSNPFAEGENRALMPPPTVLIIFGASGDLTHRKLVPALYNLHCDGYLPPGFMVLGTSRSKIPEGEFRNGLLQSVRKYSRREVTEDQWRSFARSVYYESADAAAETGARVLRTRVEALCSGGGGNYNYLHYLATSPSLFAPIATALRGAGLIEPGEIGLRSTPVVVEKPFGMDLDSARELNRTLRQSLEERQIYRIDHYLGKETVQNILVFRFANGIFEPLWNRNYIEQIQVTVAESIGVENRAAYFDRAGILRDVVQNHLLQMLALLCIEPPVSLGDADSIRDEKVKVLRSMRRYTATEAAASVVRGQYGDGFIDGSEVAGYLSEPEVPHDSRTETFVALRLEIENWRWAGVPIYIRAGKRLPKRTTEIAVIFRRPPDSLFRGKQISDLEPNVLSIQVQPHEGTSLKVTSKSPGMRMRVRPVEMDFSYGSSFGVPLPDAYERLLLDAMRGDATLFTRGDEIEQAWDVLSPILKAWQEKAEIPLETYAAGTWGPEAAAKLLRPAGHVWRRL